MYKRTLLVVGVALVCGVLLLPGIVFAETATVTVEVILFECNDGIDNDSDGLTDFPNDLGCTSATDDDEVNPACNDGIDNDGDGLTDFPGDPGCLNDEDDDETDPPITIIRPGGRSPAPRSSAPDVTDILPPRVQELLVRGFAHPQSEVTLLIDGTVRETTRANEQARFTLSLQDVTPGVYLFSLYATDINAVRSGLVTFTTTLEPSGQVLVSDVFIPPTISGDVTPAGDVVVVGQTVPESLVEVSVLRSGRIHETHEVSAASFGGYEALISRESAEESVIKTRARFSGLWSPFSIAIEPLIRQMTDALRGDVNGDGQVNLIDFSIVAFWYNRPSPPERFDVSGDGVVDLIDFSILAFHWTG